MKWLHACHLALTSLLLLACAVLAVLLSTGILELRWVPPAPRPDSSADAYPIPGRLEGTTAFCDEKDAPPKANVSYPSWFRGHGKDGLADKDSQYFYKELVGPARDVATGLNADNVRFGTLVLNPGRIYPAHSHPAPEIYYVVEGEAEWYVDDERRLVTPGSVVFHRPYAVHGWKNTSPDKPLQVVWMWWTEGDMKPAVLNKGARFTNPKLVDEPGTANVQAVPIPPVRKR